MRYVTAVFTTPQPRKNSQPQSRLLLNTDLLDSSHRMCNIYRRRLKFNIWWEFSRNFLLVLCSCRGKRWPSRANPRTHLNLKTLHLDRLHNVM